VAATAALGSASPQKGGASSDEILFRAWVVPDLVDEDFEERDYAVDS